MGRELAVTERTRVHRHPERSQADRAALHAVLDEGLLCHLALVRDGTPVVLPVVYGRQDDTLYLHGSTGSRAFRALAGGAALSLAVTLLDGLVLARSATHSSMNYRSAVVFGRATEVTGEDTKRAALKVVTEHLAPGRWAEVRPVTRKELAGTLVLALALDEASVKVRTGPPADDPEDLDLPIWAGVLPLSVTTARPFPDPTLRPGIPVPPSVTGWMPGPGPGWEAGAPAPSDSDSASPADGDPTASDDPMAGR